ncbi:MAG: hypothetical protein WDN46_04555 [Methylocella sp.]
MLQRASKRHDPYFSSAFVLAIDTNAEQVGVDLVPDNLSTTLSLLASTGGVVQLRQLNSSPQVDCVSIAIPLKLL